MLDFSPLDYCIMFIGSFTVVFLLGLQSRNVNMGRYWAAVITSAGISVSQFIFVKYASSGSYQALAVSTAGGCIGIASSIWFYRTVIEKRSDRNG